MKVSIIVPNYNHAKFLAQRLDSVLAQDYTDYELIILDDCSSDSSREIIASYKDHPRVSHVIFNEKNSGSTFAQWEKGISLAQGEYLWIAESDDYCEKNFLSVAVRKLEEGYDLFYARSVRIDEEGKLMQNQWRWYEDISPDRWKSDFANDAKDELRDVLLKKCVINNASAVVFRNVPQIKNYLQQLTGMRYAGDWLFWMQYLSGAGKICYSVETINYFRTHPGVTRMQNPARRNPEMMRIFRYVVSHPLSRGNRRALAAYFFANHFYKGNKRQLSVNIPLAFRMFFCSPLFLRCWFRYYFSSAAHG